MMETDKQEGPFQTTHDFYHRNKNLQQLQYHIHM